MNQYYNNLISKIITISIPVIVITCLLTYNYRLVKEREFYNDFLKANECYKDVCEKLCDECDKYNCINDESVFDDTTTKCSSNNEIYEDWLNNREELKERYVVLFVFLTLFFIMICMYITLILLYNRLYDEEVKEVKEEQTNNK